MGNWKDHGGSYYKCNKYEETAEVISADGSGKMSVEEQNRMAKKELDRYLHYYSRFQGHELGVKYAATTQRAIIEKKMVELQVYIFVFIIILLWSNIINNIIILL